MAARADTGAPAGAGQTLVELVGGLKRELGIDAATTLTDAVDEACATLNVEKSGSLKQRVTKCWDAIA